MDSNSPIYIKPNFQHPKISMKKNRLLLIFKVVKIASEINENGFWSFICSRKTLNSCFPTFMLLQYASKWVVVLMMINTKFWMSKLNFVYSENLIILEKYWKLLKLPKNACFLCSARLANFFHELFFPENSYFHFFWQLYLLGGKLSFR